MKNENINLLTKELLEQEFKNGLWHKDIAEKYGVSSRTIYTYVKKYNIDIDRKNKKEEKIYMCSICGKEFKSLINGNVCGHCKTKQVFEKEHVFSESESDLGQKIVNLRKQGFSYTEIAKKLNCSKSTVSYHCNNQTRIKSKERSANQIHKKNSEVEWMTLFSRRYCGFRGRKFKKVKNSKLKWKEEGQWWNKFKNVIKKFKLRTTNGTTMVYYKSEDALKHLKGPITKCYLTGVDIDMTKDDYQLDHIIPVSRGGTNELSNLGIICVIANQMKGPLTNEELFDWCKKILEYNGYTVTKN